MYDLVIVGAGPIGLAAACAAQDAQLNFLILDKAGPCQSIVEYAPRQSFYSPASELEVGGIPFPMAADDKPRREDALAYYRAVITSRRLPLQTWERVQSVMKEGDAFHVTTVQQPDAAWTKTYAAKFVLIVSGVWDQPRRLNIPGAGLHKVTTHYLDPTPFLNKDCLTIGGGNSAAEVAMSLSRAGAKSRLALIEPSFDVCNLRPFVLRELLILVEEQKIEVFFETEATEITPQAVCLKSRKDGSEQNIPNDFVFVLIGQNPDIPFLEAAGVTIDPNDQRPIYSEDTFETGVPGLYVAGSIARDQHIVNGRPNAVKIVEEIAKRVRQN
jgi:thioredoxin reductase (NADPH)